MVDAAPLVGGGQSLPQEEGGGLLLQGGVPGQGDALRRGVLGDGLRVQGHAVLLEEGHQLFRRPAEGVPLRRPALGQGEEQEAVEQEQDQYDDVLQAEAVHGGLLFNLTPSRPGTPRPAPHSRWKAPFPGPRRPRPGPGPGAAITRSPPTGYTAGSAGSGR